MVPLIVPEPGDDLLRNLINDAADHCRTEQVAVNRASEANMTV
jgi:hypothetical protein